MLGTGCLTSDTRERDGGVARDFAATDGRRAANDGGENRRRGRERDLRPCPSARPFPPRSLAPGVERGKGGRGDPGPQKLESRPTWCRTFGVANRTRQLAVALRLGQATRSSLVDHALVSRRSVTRDTRRARHATFVALDDDASAPSRWLCRAGVRSPTS